jgi:hypothetical protein
LEKSIFFALKIGQGHGEMGRVQSVAKCGSVGESEEGEGRGEERGDGRGDEKEMRRMGRVRGSGLDRVRREEGSE